jgi:hypothetical protein
MRHGGNRLVAIIGDSHAHTLFPGISEVAGRYGYDTILLANSGCPVLKGFLWGKNRKEIDACQEKIDQILRFVEENRNIEKVVMTTRGAHYIHGPVEGDYSVDSVRASLANHVDSDRMTYEKFFEGYGKTLGLLSGLAHVKEFYYYTENPELDFLPKEVIPRPFDVFGLSAKTTTVDREAHDLRMKTYKRLVRDISGSYPSVTVIDVTPYFCDENQCDAFRNGNFLYADDDHLSVFGSRFLAGQTETLLFRDTPAEENQ